MFVWVIKMIEVEKIEDSKGIDLYKADKSKECEVSHYSYWSNSFKSHSKVCNSCNWGIESFGSFAIITVNDVDYRFFMFDMTEEDVIDITKKFEANKL